MRPDLETYYLIDQYLDNELKGEELIAFEQHLAQDALFAKEVAEQRMLNDFILEAELKGVRNQIEKDLIHIQKPSFFRMHWQWIGLGILSISSILYFSISSKNDTAKQVEQSVNHPIEHTDQPVIEATKNLSTAVTDKTEIKSKSKTDISKIEVVQPNNPTKIDSVYIAPKEMAKPISNSTQVNHVPATITSVTEEAKKTDCSTTKITFSLAAETSCEDSETGSIYVEKLAGGIAPYSFSLNNKKVKEKNMFNLGAGTYEVKISDKNGCFTAHTVNVSEKNCKPAIQQGTKFNINPTIGETCSIPFNTDKKGNITIYNRGGKIVHREQNPSSEYVEWNGTDGYGALAEAGLYVYIIEYTDGTKVTGEVNIIR